MEHASQVSPPVVSAMPMIGLARTDEMRRFVALYDDALDVSPEARLALFSLPGAATFASRNIEALIGRGSRWVGEGLDVYLHIHAHALPDGDLRQRGNSETVRAAIGLFADIDARGPDRKKPAATLCPTTVEAIGVAGFLGQGNLRLENLCGRHSRSSRATPIVRSRARAGCREHRRGTLGIRAELSRSHSGFRLRPASQIVGRRCGSHTGNMALHRVSRRCGQEANRSAYVGTMIYRLAVTLTKRIRLDNGEAVRATQLVD